MKKKIKYFLLGAGSVVAGFFAYALLSDRPSASSTDTSENTQVPPVDAGAPRHSNQEYVDRRREFIRERATAARAAAAASDLTRAASDTPLAESKMPNDAIPHEENPAAERAEGQSSPEQEQPDPTESDKQQTSSESKPAEGAAPATEIPAETEMAPDKQSNQDNEQDIEQGERTEAHNDDHTE